MRPVFGRGTEIRGKPLSLNPTICDAATGVLAEKRDVFCCGDVTMADGVRMGFWMARIWPSTGFDGLKRDKDAEAGAGGAAIFKSVGVNTLGNPADCNNALILGINCRLTEGVNEGGWRWI